MPAASTTREALKNTRGSRPQSAPAAGIECVSTAHRPPSQLADATPIDSARKATLDRHGLGAAALVWGFRQAAPDARCRLPAGS